MMLFLSTLGLTIVLFIGAALVFNFSKQKTGRSRPAGSPGCQQSGSHLGCSCSAAVQTTISRL
ncbi:MAG: hypothetical protein P8X86_03590 [Desulfofustis sp.]|jgi:hypothetical protein